MIDSDVGYTVDGVRLFATVSGGVVDVMVRATDRDALMNAVKAVGLMSEIMTTTTDAETGEVTVSGTGEWQINKGVNIDHIGPMMITPGEYDDEGNEIKAPIYDSRHHANIRLTPPATEVLDENGRPRWIQWALAWTLGENDSATNKDETASVRDGVALIDPFTVNSPSRRYL